MELIHLTIKNMALNSIFWEEKSKPKIVFKALSDYNLF